MKVGLFFGSFNPIHVGHLIIANHILNESDLDRIWMVVSPHNPLKAEHSLLNEYHRLHLVQLATEDDNRIKASDIEFSLPRPSYTCDTLIHLQEKYPELIYGTKDHETELQSVDYRSMFAILARDIQELKERVARIRMDK